MTTATYRELTTDERGVLDRLLELEFRGLDAVRQQAAASTVRTIDAEGSLEFRTESPIVADVEERVPAEGWYRDDDGIRVNVLLHVVGGKVRELEIFKDDGSPIRRRPDAALIELSSRHENGGGTP